MFGYNENQRSGGTRIGVRFGREYTNDSQEGYHNDINKLIHDSKTEFSLAVKDIENNLEMFLGIELKIRSDQKPQHLLFQYDSGNISQEKIDKFCKLVEELIS